MADPGYDFFATGRTPAAAPPAAPDPAPVSRFGTPVAPVPDVVVPVAEPLAPPAPAALAAPVYGSPGYQPGAVNQFGTPLDLGAVPTGPYAAAGIGAAPVVAAGLVSTWDQPVASPPAQAPAPTTPGVSRFGNPLPPEDVYAAQVAAPAGHRAGSSPAASRPTAILVAGVIGIVEGALMLLIGVVALAGYLSLNAQLAQVASAPGAGGFSELGATVSTAILVGALLFLVFGVGYVAAGVAAVTGRRWGAWALLVVSVLAAVNCLYEISGGNASFGTILALLITTTVALLVIGVTDARRWLLRS